MDALEKIYEEQKQQRDIEEKEASYARNIAVKVINTFLCVAQVKQKDTLRSSKDARELPGGEAFAVI